MFYCYILRNDSVRNFYEYVIHEKIAINGYEVITLNIYATVVIKKRQNSSSSDGMNTNY